MKEDRDGGTGGGGGGGNTRWPCDVIASPTPPPVMGPAAFLGTRKRTQRAAVLACVTHPLVFFPLFLAACPNRD